jgi:DNA invertase Pin-like site-specific DNA recombinase
VTGWNSYDPATDRKLTPAQSTEIRARYEDGETLFALATEFRVSAGTIRKYVQPRRPPAHRVTAADKAEMRRRRAAGETLLSIAADFGVAHSTVRKITMGDGS